MASMVVMSRLATCLVCSSLLALISRMAAASSSGSTNERRTALRGSSLVPTKNPTLPSGCRIKAHAGTLVTLLMLPEVLSFCRDWCSGVSVALLRMFATKASPCSALALLVVRVLHPDLHLVHRAREGHVPRGDAAEAVELRAAELEGRVPLVPGARAREDGRRAVGGQLQLH